MLKNTSSSCVNMLPFIHCLIILLENYNITTKFLEIRIFCCCIYTYCCCF